MRSTLLSGIVAGLAAGILIGLLLSAIVPGDMALPGHSLMELVAGAMGTQHLAIAWIATLGVGALLGVIFSGLVRRARDAGTVAALALGAALALWVVVATIGAPLLIGARPFVGLTNMKAWPLVVGGLMLGLIFWSIVAAGVLWLRAPRAGAEATAVRDLRRAA
jgi:hypothetical protein